MEQQDETITGLEVPRHGTATDGDQSRGGKGNQAIVIDDVNAYKASLPLTAASRVMKSISAFRTQL